MKNLNWILHGIALAGLLFLFIQNRQLQRQASTATSASPAADKAGSFQVAYFNSDSLLPKLNFFKKSESDFKQKQEDMLNELKGKEDQLRREFQTLQKNAENMTRNEMESAQKRLAGLEQDLMQRKEDLSTRFAAETAEFNEALHKKVIAFLQEYNASGKYHYIFSVARDGNIFYWDPSLDITSDMVEGLNAQYK
ncbi:MAG: OmpH family outer membrane protein [Saprospiraceae bacterium]|jgi:outer membrane protein|nr:OmpH family outer membrane protein [Saprospiraceae bacterium]MBP9208811.1 OmpH family outer membrane protein [Saprospiraceae bacterium]MBV6472375.1 hypothetical protein [Saprospiraceae bacterium]